MSAEAKKWVKNEAPSWSDSCESSPAALELRMAMPWAPSGGSMRTSKLGETRPPLTRVTAPERQASMTSTRAVAAEPATSARSSCVARRVPARCNDSASAWPE